MRTAAIDIGTNSVLLLVVQPQTDGSIEVLHEDCIITRLGRGVDRTRALEEQSIERTLGALQRYADRLRELEVGPRAAVGTSALRDARNGPEFLARADAILGCSVDVITGAREAELVLRGIEGSFAPLAEGTLIVDVGGGSTELIRIGRHRSVARISLDVGTVRLTERHVDRDPPTDAVAAIRQTVRDALVGLPPWMGGPASRMIGVAGTVTTLLTIEQGIDPYDAERVNGARLSLAQVAALAERLAGMPLSQRRELPGLPPARADVIPTGALLVHELMQHAHVGEIEVSDRGVRWGLVYELL